MKNQVDLAHLTHTLANRLEVETSVVQEQFQSRIDALSNSPREKTLAQEDWTREKLVREALLKSIHNHEIRLDSVGAIFLAGFPLKLVVSE